MSLIDQLNDDDARDFLSELVREQSLDGAALGIAKLLADKGSGDLSDKQRFVLEQALDGHVTKECKRCGGNIPWSEMFEARDNGGLCSWCRHMTTKGE